MKIVELSVHHPHTECYTQWFVYRGFLREFAGKITPQACYVIHLFIARMSISCAKSLGTLVANSRD